MAVRKFNPRTVMRQVSNHLWAELLETMGVHVGFDWREMRETKIEPLYELWQSLDEPLHRKLELLMQDIHVMADSIGTQAIYEESRAKKMDDLVRELSEFESRHDVAMWTRLRAGSVWSAALRFAKADRKIGTRFWHRRNDLPECEVDCSDDAIERLSDALTALHMAEEGRGRLCVTEHFQRGDGSHYFNSYLDDWRDSYVKVADDGRQFERAFESKAFELMFHVDPKLRTLDIDARGGRRRHNTLQAILGRCILHTELPPEDDGNQVFALGILLDPMFRFPTDPADGIKSVRVKQARIRVQGCFDRMTFDPDRFKGPRRFDYNLDTYIESTGLPRSNMDVERAVLDFELDGHDHPAGEKISVALSTPNRSNTMNLDHVQRELTEKYLRQWGIDRGIDSRTLA